MHCKLGNSIYLLQGRLFDVFHDVCDGGLGGGGGGGGNSIGGVKCIRGSIILDAMNNTSILS